MIFKFKFCKMAIRPIFLKEIGFTISLRNQPIALLVRNE